MSDKDIILLSAAISLILADGLNADELNTLGNFIACIGNNLMAAGAQEALREAKNDKGGETQPVKGDK